MKIAILGTGNMAVECIQIALRHTSINDIIVIMTEQNSENGVLLDFCVSQKIPYILVATLNDPDSLKSINEFPIDILFNINSMILFPNKFLEIPRISIVNFHNGPLPLYKGLNVCSWALINGEDYYGITWHYISKNQGIDSGNILINSKFKISSQDNAFSLILKCVNEGIDSFESAYIAALNQEQGHLQKDEGSIYYKNQTPNDGFIELDWDFERINNLIRGLSFFPLKNTFLKPKVIKDGQVRNITRASVKVDLECPIHDDQFLINTGNLCIFLDLEPINS